MLVCDHAWGYSLASSRILLSAARAILGPMTDVLVSADAAARATGHVAALVGTHLYEKQLAFPRRGPRALAGAEGGARIGSALADPVRPADGSTNRFHVPSAAGQFDLHTSRRDG